MFRMGGRSDDGIMSLRKKYEEGGEVDEFNYLEDTPFGRELSKIATATNRNIADVGTAAYDLVGVPLNQLTKFFTGKNPGFSGTRFFQNVPIVKDSITDRDPNKARFFFADTDATPTLFGGKGINLGGAANAEEPGAGAGTGAGKGAGAGTGTGGKTEQLSKDDLKTMYEDLLPLFKTELSADEDELRRQKYLELAKFGANILAQPGGDLIGTIGKAAAPSLEGLTRVAETKRRADAAAKSLALEAALKQVDPGTIMKQVKDIMRLDPSLTQKEALAKVLSTGSATKERTSEDRISTYAENLYEDDIVGSKTAGRKAAEAIEASGKGIGAFEKDPGAGERVPGAYYILKDGKIGKYKGKDKKGQEDFAEPGDKDF